MPTRSELRALADLRLKEAQALYDERLYDGCVYLCGYVIEMALKARICRVLGIQNYPEEGEIARVTKTHDFDTLKILAGLEALITAANPQLMANWSIATQWTPKQRYDPPGKYDAVTARGVLDSIREKPNGVLTWLRRRW